ncbi:unnamed protein product, partial [Ixodes hexagonus]
SKVAPEFQKKLVIVGDGGSGKTSMLTTFATGVFPENPEATLIESIITDVNVGNKKVRLSMCDTAGQETYDRLRTHSYTDAAVVVIVFSIDVPESLVNVEARWNPEVRHFCFKVPCLLVGNKKDLRDCSETLEVLREMRQSPVTYQEGAAVAKKIKAKAYLECSALDKQGVQEVFQKATRLAIGVSTLRS